MRSREATRQGPPLPEWHDWHWLALLAVAVVAMALYCWVLLKTFEGQ